MIPIQHQVIFYRAMVGNDLVEGGSPHHECREVIEAPAGILQAPIWIVKLGQGDRG